jgi:hypothetical protein
VAAGAEDRTLRKLSRKVRKVTRVLGPIRALDVGIALLADLESTFD